MKKILYIILVVILLMTIVWFSLIYYVPYSRGTRSGELIKVSNKGVIFKTWEGEISQGISGAQIFSFSILDKDKSVIEKLQDLQGNYVKVSYVERYTSFVFWGDTKYFIVEVQKETSPHFNKD
ncbi:MAG: 6-phosphogluconate dehydrogenase [Flavobacteriaceae bacterium]|nr:6-phosphogluconate dehydrogenase [Flavobacteriaceae bacterium]